jgi:hypothetical protein
MGNMTYFEFRDHVLLGIIRHALVEEETLGEMLLVVALEDVLLLEETEEDKTLVEDHLNLLLRHLHSTTQQQSMSASRY